LTHEQENNSIAITIKLAFELKTNLSDADLSDANLRGADLRGADLSDANLRGADLRGADLSDANLSYANLSGVDLSDADLSGADLSDADLSDANLRGADLRGANGNMKEIKSMRLNKWAISFTAEVMAIGCQQHSIEDWKGFDDSKINCMGSSALEWWKKWKDFIFKAIELANT